MNSIATANFDIAATLVRAAVVSTLPTARTAISDAAPVASSNLTDKSPTLSSAETTLTAVVARILQAASTNTTANNAPTSATSAVIILTQLLNSTNAAAPMDLNLNQLLNSALPPDSLAQGSLTQQTLAQQTATQKALSQLPLELLSRPQVIEALVLQNTLLPATANKEQPALPLLILPNLNTTATPPSTNTLYRVNIEWQSRVIQLLSPQPLPTGTRVPLQIDARGAITLLRPEIAAKILLAQNTIAPVSLTQSSAPPTPTQAIQQSLRELLPRQQALHTLVPLLQKFIQPTVRTQLPQPVFKALAQLLQALPKPAQLNNVENLKQTLNNSGSFFESRIARALLADPATAAALPNIFAGDLKAQIGALLAIIRKFVPETPAHAPLSAGEDDFVYAAKPGLSPTAPHATPSGDNDHLDTLLSQLSKLLEAGFARIQLNQLDSASARHINHETQMPVPTWVLELPLRTPHGVDQLQVRIEQRHARQQQHARVQWNVEIAFDLHAAGKLAASLAIIDKSVSATLWAEREYTHRRVREEMDYLRAGLESVGVNVTEMQCRLGLPAPRSNPISQQLVDIHT